MFRTVPMLECLEGRALFSVSTIAAPHAMAAQTAALQVAASYPTVRGTYTLSFHDALGGSGTGKIYITLQSGRYISGKITVWGHTVPVTGTVTATNKISFVANANGVVGTATGTYGRVAHRIYNATYNGILRSVGGSHGTFAAIRL